MPSLEEFKSFQVRIGKVVAASRVEGSDKLLNLQIDFGSETRQILSGIGRTFEPEDLLQKQIPVLCGIEPRSIMGFESQGMVLAADNDGTPVLLSPETEVPPGTPVI